jgi:glyoxylase-like metal-dependent hydrolase (beta-lactamase superfamily II)
MQPRHVHAGIYQVGGSGLSGSGDCMCYAVDCRYDQIALIDCGVDAKPKILANMTTAGLDVTNLKHIFLTHVHIDHTGAAASFQEEFPEAIFYAHELEVPAIEGAPGTAKLTAASWYGVNYIPVQIQHVIQGEEETMPIGDLEFHCIHIPGHTVGSMAIYIDVEDQRVLFGQDVHGPIMPEFGSNMQDYQASLRKLLALDADILCEGHHGIMVSKREVQSFIKDFVR